MNRTSHRTAIYARVSTDKQNPLSPADQERKCREYADRNGIAVVEGQVYSDEGLSGLTFASRYIKGPVAPAVESH